MLELEKYIERLRRYEMYNAKRTNNIKKYKIKWGDANTNANEYSVNNISEPTVRYIEEYIDNM